VTAISLGLPLRAASNDLLGELGAGHAVHLTVFLQLGFAAQGGLPSWGELLPHHFTLTVVGEPTGRRSHFCGTFPIPRTESIRETVGVTHQLALCSPDFPPVLAHRRPSGGRTAGR